MASRVGRGLSASSLLPLVKPDVRISLRQPLCGSASGFPGVFALSIRAPQGPLGSLASRSLGEERLFRGGTYVQSVLNPSYPGASPAGSLGSAGIGRVIATMDPSDSRRGPPAVIDSQAGARGRKHQHRSLHRKSSHAKARWREEKQKRIIPFRGLASSREKIAIENPPARRLMALPRCAARRIRSVAGRIVAARLRDSRATGRIQSNRGDDGLWAVSMPPLSAIDVSLLDRQSLPALGTFPAICIVGMKSISWSLSE